MAVPGRRNGLMGDDEEDGGIIIDEEDIEYEQVDANTPPHLRQVAIAAERGDLESLRHALGTQSCSPLSSITQTGK